MLQKAVLIVKINGDKTGFNSKSAVDKFKSHVKNTKAIDLEDLKKRFIKSDYVLEIESQTDTSVDFKITNNHELALKRSRELLRAKLNLMSNNRTNVSYYKAKASNKVPDEILKEYAKLIKISKIPVPEPSEVLSKPEEYKSLISSIISSPMMAQLGAAHSHSKYFKLLAKELGIDTALPVPIRDFSGAPTDARPVDFGKMIKMAGPIDSADVDTEEED
jgi:hypothetical protein